MQHSTDLDVAVVGLGTMGSMALWQLSKRPGLRVGGFEQYGIGHAHGAFAGESRLFRAAYHEGEFYVPMLLRARELWQELNGLVAHDVYLQTGTLSVGETSSEQMRNVLTSVQKHGLPHEVLDHGELLRRYPQYRVGQTTTGILDLYGGALRPERSVLTAIDLATTNGAGANFSEPVVRVEVEDAGFVTIITSRRRITASKVVLAGGPWAAQLDPTLSSKFEIVPLLLTWFSPTVLEDFLPDRFPAFIVDEGGVHFFGAPSLDNYTVKISPSLEHRSVTLVEDIALRVAPEVLSMVGAQANAIFPGLPPEPSRYSVHPEGYAAGKVPIIDLGHDGRVVTLTAFSGHGFKFAPLVGEMAAALAVDGEHQLHDSSFSIAAHPAL